MRFMDAMIHMIKQASGSRFIEKIQSGFWKPYIKRRNNVLHFFAVIGISNAQFFICTNKQRQLLNAA